MTYQLSTDEDWEKLAECIVTKHPSISPELVGELTVDATQTIFTWYKGEERSKFLGEKHYARDRLMRLAREAGCLEEPSVQVGGCYWEVTNMEVGGIAQSGESHPTTDHALRAAKDTLNIDFRHWKGHHLVIKVFNKSPSEREGVTYTPIHTESFWVNEDVIELSKAGEMVEFDISKKEPIPVPQTYGDWVSLAMDIKQKAGIDDFETTASVNEHLENIYSEEPSAEDSKRWLVEKAGELGIQ